MKKELFKKGTMSLGVNYWASHAATRMWTEWDETVVENDIKNLAEIGCEYLRVFPLWPDFQPIMILRANCYKGGYKRGYAFTGERPLPKTEAGRAGVDETMMERFEKLCDIAQQYKMKVIVPLINGHMTFRIYNPPAVDGLDHFTDPESLMWQGKFIHYFVKRMKHHPAIVAWEIGNECNCLSAADNRAAAWSWSAFVTDAVRAEDNTRPVISGMHSLCFHETRNNPASSGWTFADQAELCDVLTSHPYPMWRNYVNCDKPNTLRWVLLTPAENQLYADVTNSESFAEEVGTLRRTFSTFEALGDNLRNMLWLLWDNDSRALLWWCAYDQTGMEFPPYDWDEAGMEHGILTADYKLNPTGRAIRDFAKFKESCPVKVLPEPREKAICIYGRDQRHYEMNLSISILAKQAGLPIKSVFCEDEIPDSSVYLIPCAQRKGGLNRAAYKTLFEKAKNGATVYMSFEYNTCIPLMEEFFGFEIENREQNSSPVSIKIDGIPEIKLTPKYKFTMKSHGATLLDKEGIVWEYKVGKGRVIAVALPLENMLLGIKDSFQKYPAYELYRIIGKNITDKNVISCSDCEVIVSEHPENENTLYAIVCNCSPDNKKVSLNIKDGFEVENCYSDIKEVSFDSGVINLPNNCGALLVLKKKAE